MLLPEDYGSDDDEALGVEALGGAQKGMGQRGQKPGDRRAAPPPAALPGGRGGALDAADEEEVVPVSAQVQARLEGITLQLDTFAPASPPAGEQVQQGSGAASDLGASAASDASPGSSLRLRCALQVRNLEVRDSFQRNLQAGSAAAADAAATGWSDLRRMLGYHASVHRVRDAKACMVQLVVEGIQAEPGSGQSGTASLGACSLVVVCSSGARQGVHASLQIASWPAVR